VIVTINRLVFVFTENFSGPDRELGPLMSASAGNTH